MILRHHRTPSQHHRTDFSLSVRINDVEDADRGGGRGGEKRCDKSNDMSETEPGNTADDAGADPEKHDISCPWPF